MAQGTDWDRQFLTCQGQGLQREDPPELSHIYTPDQKEYQCYGHKETPTNSRAGIQVHLVPGGLSVYEVVREGWQLNVINRHVALGDATVPFLHAVAEAYRQMATPAPTIIMGDMNGAATPAYRGGQVTPQDNAVWDTIVVLGIMDLTAELEGQSSHFPHQTEAARSRIDVCDGDPTTIIWAEA